MIETASPSCPACTKGKTGEGRCDMCDGSGTLAAVPSTVGGTMSFIMSDGHPCYYHKDTGAVRVAHRSLATPFHDHGEAQDTASRVQKLHPHSQVSVEDSPAVNCRYDD